MENGRYGILCDMSRDISTNSNQIYSNYAGIRCKGGKNIHITYNTLTGHAQALYINSGTEEIGMQRYIKYNKIINNNVAFHFAATIKNNTIKYNNIIGNLEDVVRDAKSGKNYKNDIEMNYWDRYIGFDKNSDGISDMPYQVGL